jgi:hypothetical protein
LGSPSLRRASFFFLGWLVADLGWWVPGWGPKILSESGEKQRRFDEDGMVGFECRKV